MIVGSRVLRTIMLNSEVEIAAIERKSVVLTAESESYLIRLSSRDGSVVLLNIQFLSLFRLYVIGLNLIKKVFYGLHFWTQEITKILVIELCRECSFFVICYIRCSVIWRKCQESNCRNRRVAVYEKNRNGICWAVFPGISACFTSGKQEALLLQRGRATHCVSKFSAIFHKV